MASTEQDFENKIFSDQHERLSLGAKIDKQLDALKNKSDGILQQAEQKISQDALKDTIAELEGQEKNPDELILSDHDDKKKDTLSTSPSSPLNVQKILEETIGNENPLANQGRVVSYTNVSDFATTVAQQGGIFGKLINRLS